MVQSARSSKAQAAAQDQPQAQITSEKLNISAEQIYVRFPKEKHEEFMRRAIANSRNLLKSFELWSGIAAHEPIW